MAFAFWPTTQAAIHTHFDQTYSVAFRPTLQCLPLWLSQVVLSRTWCCSSLHRTSASVLPSSQVAPFSSCLSPPREHQHYVIVLTAVHLTLSEHQSCTWTHGNHRGPWSLSSRHAMAKGTLAQGDTNDCPSCHLAPLLILIRESVTSSNFYCHNCVPWFHSSPSHNRKTVCELAELQRARQCTGQSARCA